MKNPHEILAILDSESVRGANAPDMRRVMNELACGIRSAMQLRVKRGEIVRYDGVGDVEVGRQPGGDVGAAMGRAVRTARLWGVDI